MIRLIIDETLHKRLAEIDTPAELCDSSGRVVGRFTPILDLSKYEYLTPDITDEELQRRKQSNEKRYTTAEMLAYLDSPKKMY